MGIKIVWQVWNFGAGRYEFASYDEQAAVDFARTANGGPVPAFTVERCHLVGGRAV